MSVENAMLKLYTFLLSRRAAGSGGFAAEAVFLTLVSILGILMMTAGDAIGAIINRAIAAIGGG